MKHILCGLCWFFEHLCCLTHPFVGFEIKVTGRHCNLCHIAFWLDEKYNLGYWVEEVREGANE